jgi:hypothetical protein
MRLMAAAIVCSAGLPAPLALGDEPNAAGASPPPMSLNSPPTRFMTVDELSVELGFDSWGSSRKVKTDPQPLSLGGYSQRNKDIRFDESLGLRSSGNFINDDVLRYDAYVRGGLSQESYYEKGPWRDETKNPNGDLLEYDLRLQAFQAGKVSGTAFASQLDSRIPRPFLPSLDQTRSRYGGGLTYQDAKRPMSLTWESTKDQIDGHLWSYEDKEEQSEDRLRYEATWQPTEDHSLNLQYEYQNSLDRYSGTDSKFKTQRNLLSLTDTVQFGEEKKHRFETLLRLEEERGDLAHDSFEISPQLRLKHSDKLFSTYRAQYLKENFQNIETDTHRGDVGLTHILSDALTSSFNLYGLQQSADSNADMAEIGELANFAYSKENDLGRFSANLSYLHTNSQTDGGKRDAAVIGEAVTFRDPLPAILAHSDVNILTVVVTSSTGIQIFLPGRDYVVIPMGRYTALQRVPTGLILNLQTVLVTYTYRVINNFSVARDRVDVRIQEDFKTGLTPYYAASVQDESVTSDKFLSWQERDVHRHRLGTTYRKQDWSVGPEYEYNNDSIDPYQAVHLNGDIVLLRTARHEISGRAVASRFWFEGKDWYTPDRNTSLIDLGVNYRYQLTDRIDATADAMYRFEKDSIFGRTQGIDLRGAVAYRIGQFSLLFEVEYDSLDLPTSSDDSMTFWIKLRREILVIGKPRQ